MVKGLDVFREYFKDFDSAYVLIGGAACDQRFAELELPFRATKDLDVVLVIEVIDPAFFTALKTFIGKGGYKIFERAADGRPILYRFSEPTDPDFPAKLELSSRKPDRINLGDDQKYIPIPEGEGIYSLSAVLLNDIYYSLVIDHHSVVDGLSVADVTALIPLKVHAWLNLTARQERGEKVDSRDINKHRNDVFRLAGTLPGEPGPTLPEPILADLKAFLAQFPADSAHWKAILASIKATLGGTVRPGDLLKALATYFQI